MEMPTPCENCGEIFDLNDGRRSPRKRNIVICESCAEKEQEEIDREEEIILLREQIGEAEDTLICAKERLRKLGAERQIEEIADAGLTEQAELAALRAKLAAAESVIAAYNEWHDDLDETGCPTGGVHCPICSGGGHWDRRQNSPIRHKPDCPREAYNHVELLSVIPGTTVAAALAELRATVSFEAVSVEYPPDLVGEYIEKKQVLSDIDATIAKLGLAEQEQPK